MLIRGAVHDVRDLAQAEFALAKLELEERLAGARESVAHAVPGIAAGGLVAVVGVMVTLVGAVLLLDLWLPAWAACVAVGLPCAAGGSLAIVRAVRPRASDVPIPALIAAQEPDA